MQFSSKDFAKVQASLNSEVPEKLHHAAVAEHLHGSFSAERGHGVAIVDLPSKTLSLTLGMLKVAEGTRLHRHNYETILYVLKGEGYTLINERRVDWKAGDAVYIPVWAWHRHVNTSGVPAEYLACENAPLLQNLGNIALREEAPLL